MAQEPLSLHPHPRTLVREELKRDYIDVLLAGSSLPKRVINVHSITGMGKTWLGYLMFAQTHLKPTSMAVWISFEQSEDKPLPVVQPATPIVHVDNAKLLAQLSEQPFYKRLRFKELTKLAESIGDHFVCHYRLAPAAEPNGPLLLFFDGLNYLIHKELEQPGSIGSLWDYTEKQVFEPVAQQTNTLTFCFSHAPQIWNSHILREFGRQVNLEALSRPEVRELLHSNQLSGQAVEDFVFDVSQGHPWTIHYLLLEDPGLLKAPLIMVRAVSNLPQEYRELLAIVGVLRVAEVASIESLLQTLNIVAINKKPITKQLIRGALSAYGNAGLFESSTIEQRTRFSKALRRTIEASVEHDRLRALLNKIADYYHSRVFSSENIPTSDRLGALREWLYFQIQLVAASQIAETDLRPRIDDLGKRVADILEDARAYFHKTFNLLATGTEIWERAGVLQDAEIYTMLRSLGLSIDVEGRLAPIEPQITLDSGHSDAVEPQITLDSRQYGARVVDTLLPRILKPYELEPEDIQPLGWIAEHKAADQGITLGVLRESYQQLGRPEPKRSLLRSQLSRYTAANIVHYNYDKNVYYLNDWLRSMLSLSHESDAIGGEG